MGILKGFLRIFSGGCAEPDLSGGSISQVWAQEKYDAGTSGK